MISIRSTIQLKETYFAVWRYRIIPIILREGRDLFRIVKDDIFLCCLGIRQIYFIVYICKYRSNWNISTQTFCHLTAWAVQITRENCRFHTNTYILSHFRFFRHIHLIGSTFYIRPCHIILANLPPTAYLAQISITTKRQT